MCDSIWVESENDHWFLQSPYYYTIIRALIWGGLERLLIISHGFMKCFSFPHFSSLDRSLMSIERTSQPSEDNELSEISHKRSFKTDERSSKMSLNPPNRKNHSRSRPKILSHWYDTYQTNLDTWTLRCGFGWMLSYVSDQNSCTNVKILIRVIEMDHMAVL